MVGLNVIQGSVFLAIGLALVTGARPLALLPRRYPGFFYGAARFTSRLKSFLLSDSGVHALTIFWRVDGILAILSGLSMIVDKDLIIRIPGR